MTEASFRVHEDEIRITTHFHHRDRCKSLGDATWHPAGKYWSVAATPQMAQAIREAFRGVGNCRVDKAFQALMAKPVDVVPDDNGFVMPDWLRDIDPREVDGDELPDPPLWTTPQWGHQKQAFWFVVKLWGGLPAHEDV